MLRLYDTRNLNFELKMEVQARDVGWAVVVRSALGYGINQHVLRMADKLERQWG